MSLCDSDLFLTRSACGMPNNKKPEIQLVIFIGPQGCGKGEHSRRLHSRLGEGQSLLVETSEILRREQNRRIHHFLRAGKIVPDTYVNKAIGRHIESNAKKVVVLDGFPRTEGQAEFLLTEGPALLGITKIIVVELSLSDEECITRIQQGKAEGTRPDRVDDEERKLRKRLRTYREHAPRVIEHLRGNENVLHFCIKPAGKVESTQLAIRETILPHLGMRSRALKLSARYA